MKIIARNLRRIGVLCCCGLTGWFAMFSCGQQSFAATVEDFIIIIANGDPNDIDKAFSMQDSEIGAITSMGGPASPPSGNPSFPAGTRGPTFGITLDGDVAVTHPNGLITSSNSDVHAMNQGPGSVGAQGIDSENSFNGTT